MRSVSSTWCQSQLPILATCNVLLNFHQRTLVLRPKVWFHTRMKSCWSKICITNPNASVTGGSPGNGNALYHWGHWGLEKRYGSTRDDDADAGSPESSPIVITRGRDEEDGAETGFALGITDEEADALALGLADADATLLFVCRRDQTNHGL